MRIRVKISRGVSDQEAWYGWLGGGGFAFGCSFVVVPDLNAPAIPNKSGVVWVAAIYVHAVRHAPLAIRSAP